jgi:hypothetical protein
MKNCIILGSGRSGTSMVAGTLAGAGYFMGERLYGPREGNPKGFFESPDVNGVNEDILARAIPRRPPVIGRWFYRDRPAPRQRWLARVPTDTPMPCPARASKRIECLVQRSPFCFKDPRFCYTLPAWRPFLENTVFVCVFRHPAATAASIVKECKDAPYLHSLYMNSEIALEVWRLMHEHVLSLHRHEGEWLFLHFDQVLGDDGLERLGRHVDARVDHEFPDAALRRSLSSGCVPQMIKCVYDELCQLSGYKPP